MSDPTPALFESVADALSDRLEYPVTIQEVTDQLDNRHGVPSDTFWAIWDSEVADLIDRWAQATGIEVP